MRTLCIDTSAATALALVEDGKVLASGRAGSPRRHAEELSALTSALTKEMCAHSPKGLGVQRICVGTGPGPFTGLRAGIAFANALGLALDVPVLGLWSQEALAASGLLEANAEAVLALSDARRGEVYWGIYKGKPRYPTVVVPPSVGPLADALKGAEEHGVSTVVGPARVVKEVEGGVKVFPTDLRPELLALLADSPGRTFGLEPLYLRRPDIQGQAEQELPVPAR